MDIATIEKEALASFFCLVHPAWALSLGFQNGEEHKDVDLIFKYNL